MTEEQEDLDYFKDFDTKVPLFSSKKLCEIIVSSRYLGMMQDQAILCMQELVKRREAGDVFNFEEYIETEFKKLPSFKIDLKKIINISGWDIKNLIGKIP